MRMNNMTTMTTGLGIGLLCAFISMGACTPNGNSGGGTSAQPYQQPQNTPQQMEPQRGISAPVVLNLRGPNPVPSNGPIVLDLEIVVNEPIQAPVALQIALPEGAQLSSGLPSESLSLLQPGRLYRQYVVQTASPLRYPVVVTAQAKGPNDAWGFNARREYPTSDILPPHPPSPNFGRPPVVRP